MGSTCELFVRESRKGTECEVIASFSGEKEEWIRVRCGRNVHDVLSDHPDLKKRVENNTPIIVDIDKQTNSK